MAPPPPPPPRRVPKQPVTKREEPGFEELLVGSYPFSGPEMLTERPLRPHCFVERDEAYFFELDRLKQAVVMHTIGFQWDLSVDNVATCLPDEFGTKGRDSSFRTK